MKKILLSLVAVLMFAGILHAAGTSSPITGFSWDNVRKVVRFMTSDGNEIQVAEAPKQYVGCASGCQVTVSGTNSFIPTRTVFIPYRTADGAWRLRMNIIGTNGASGSTVLTVTGVVFKTTFLQSLSCADMSANIGCRAYTSAGAATLSYVTLSGTSTSLSVAGDVEMDGKPAWAD